MRRHLRWKWLLALFIGMLTYPGAFGAVMFPLLVALVFAWALHLSDEHSGRH